MKKSKPVLKGTLRIKAKDLKVYEKTNNSWKKSRITFPCALKIIELFKAHKNFDILVDKKNSEFLKGQFYDGKVQGARINVLPDNRKLDKAYSLFSPNLIMHDQKSNQHWDVIYQLPNGNFAYAYTLDKKQKATAKKYNEVKKFEKLYPKLKQSVSRALKNENDSFALPMYTLLETYMRVGNELYFKAHGHKGLTTLTKKDIKIKGNNITFKYLAKGGVPFTITHKFPLSYVNRLKNHIKNLKQTSYVFTTESGHTLRDEHFKKAFKKYCGYAFYPHIVRSYYATNVVEQFLKKHKHASKDEVKELYLSIAQKLGHKHFDKKKNQWQDNFNVTINHYVQPKLIENMKNIVE